MKGSAKGDRDDLAAFYDRAALHTPLLGVSTRAGRFLVDVRDQAVGRVLFVKHGRGEIGVLERAMAVLDRMGRARRATDGVFVDAGANIGTTSVAALRQHGFAGAVCIEPDVANRRLLELNLMLNDVDDLARVVPVALSDHSGREHLILSSRNFGNHRLAALGQPTAGSAHRQQNVEVEVEIASVDDLIKSEIIDPATTGMFWLDIQGAEALALAGASELLRYGVPVVFELDASRLRRAGGVASITASVADWYDRVVNLRTARGRPGAPDTVKYQALPLTALESLADSQRLTDVLLLPRSATGN